MCIIISTLYVECMHKHYQNTFKCASARGSSLFQSSRNFTLERTIHLPDQQPKQIPHPLCDGNIKKATRPVTGRCKTCIREEKEDGYRGRPPCPGCRSGRCGHGEECSEQRAWTAAARCGYEAYGPGRLSWSPQLCRHRKSMSTPDIAAFAYMLAG